MLSEYTAMYAISGTVSYGGTKQFYFWVHERYILIIILLTRENANGLFFALSVCCWLFLLFQHLSDHHYNPCNCSPQLEIHREPVRCPFLEKKLLKNQNELQRKKNVLLTKYSKDWSYFITLFVLVPCGFYSLIIWINKVITEDY